MKMMKNLHDVPHGSEWKLFHDLLDIALDPSKRGGPNTKLETMAFNLIDIGSLKHYIAIVGIETQTHVVSLNMINSSLTTKLEGPSIAL